MSRRSPETLADYLVVALCPALIMLLVGSLMWFLVEVFYQGEYKLRLLWVLAMYVLAIVGIARIAMEKGMAYASMFGWALGAAVALALSQFVKDGLVVGGPLLLLVWWAAHKLTWDCTLIDDTQDASGEGLLQQMGLEVEEASRLSGTIGGTNVPDRPEAYPTLPMASAADNAKPWWETFLEPDRRPHAPGVWVVYFSLAALPLFGIGGWFVPASDPVRRANVFGLLVLYVASGLGLLLATSFLGLRRYLRQRKLDMPLEMTSTWIVAGIGIIVVTLLVATVLPRPSREYSLSQLPFTVTSAVRRASRLAMGREGTTDDASKTAAQTGANETQKSQRQGDAGGKSQPAGAAGKQGDQPSQSGKQADQQQSGQTPDNSVGQSKQSNGGGGQSAKAGKTQKTNKAGQQQGESQRDDEKSPNDQTRSSQPTPQQPPPEQQRPEQQRTEQQPSEPKQTAQQSADSTPQTPLVSRVTSWIGQLLLALFRLLFYLGLLIAGLAVAWIYREELLAAWQKLLVELRELWQRWFGKPPAAAEGDAAQAAAGPAPPRPFAAFADPFLSGDAAQMPWPRLVRYTFEALEAWGREQGCPRDPGQTAHEFAQALAATEPKLASPVQSLVTSYSQLAFAPHAQSKASPEPLRKLWQAMTARQIAAPLA